VISTEHEAEQAYAIRSCFLPELWNPAFPGCVLLLFSFSCSKRFLHLAFGWDGNSLCDYHYMFYENLVKL